MGSYSTRRWSRAGSTYNVQLFATVMNRHIPASPRILFVRKKLVHEVLGCETSLRKHALLAVLTEYHVLLGQGGGGSDADSLLAGGDHVEADTALALGVEHDQIHDGDQQHVLVQLDHLIVRQVGLERRVHHVAVLVDGTIGGHGIVRGGLFELQGGGERGLDGAGELDVFRIGTLGERACETIAGGHNPSAGGGGGEGTQSPQGGREIG